MNDGNNCSYLNTNWSEMSNLNAIRTMKIEVMLRSQKKFYQSCRPATVHCEAWKMKFNISGILNSNIQHRRGSFAEIKYFQFKVSQRPHTNY